MRLVFVAIISLVLSGCGASSNSTQDAPNPICDDIWTINSVTIRQGQADLAKRYYEAAWLPARVVAKENGTIKDFRLLRSDKPEQPGIQLITLYEDDAQFAASEDAFQSIFKVLDLPRPLLIDGVARADIFSDTMGADDYRVMRSELGSCR
ncbi:MAG: hypothetical protein ACSHX3_12990 [Litorimonas sp.]